MSLNIYRLVLVLIFFGTFSKAQKPLPPGEYTSTNKKAIKYYEEGQKYFQIRKDAEAEKELVKAIKEDDNFIEAHVAYAQMQASKNNFTEAEIHYKRAIEIDPNYFNALLNLSELLLRADEKFVTEMNKLGTSEKDNKRYEVIKAERNKNFRSMLPYLEKAVELKPNDEAAKKTLLSVYNALEMTDKYKALKAKN